MKYALIGEKLGHSYSKSVHEALCDYEYELKEIAREDLDAFLRAREFSGLNVTIPYKQTVIPYVDHLTETAKTVGAVNTLYFDENGALWGDNTDVYGFKTMLASAGIDVKGKKALVLGSGGTSLTARFALAELGAREIHIVSRAGEVNYDNVYSLHADADIIINTTPVGMFPKCGEKPIELARFAKLSGVADVIYNPARTALLQEAGKLGIPHAGGLIMLIAQAARSAERFTGRSFPEEEWMPAFRDVAFSLRGVAIVGMPGSGKSVIANRVAQLLGRECIDLDAEIEKDAGMTIPDIFAKEGEAAFRDRGEKITLAFSKGNSVISTGGGCVLREKNREALRANSLVVWLRRDIDKLARGGRPLSQGNLAEMAAKREEFYRAASDIEVINDSDIETAANTIVRTLKEGAANL